MAIQVGDIRDVKRFEKFSLEIPIEINFEYIIESMSLTAIGTKDAGIALSVSDNVPIISGQYTSSYSDNILFVNKGEATRLQIFEYDDSQPDGFAKDEEGENIPLDIPLVLSEEKFQEEKIKFPSLVQPTKITSIEQLPKNKDLVLALQDSADSINAQYQLAIEYSTFDQESGATETQDTLLLTLDHSIETDTVVFQNILENYYERKITKTVANNFIPDVDTRKDPNDDEDDDEDTEEIFVTIPEVVRAINYRIVSNKYTIVEGESVTLRCIGDNISDDRVEKRYYIKVMQDGVAVGDPVRSGTFEILQGKTLSKYYLDRIYHE